MIHAGGVVVLAAILLGVGVAGVVGRTGVHRLVATVLVGVSGVLLLSAAGALGQDRRWSGQGLAVTAISCLLAWTLVLAAVARRRTPFVELLSAAVLPPCVLLVAAGLHVTVTGGTSAALIASDPAAPAAQDPAILALATGWAVTAVLSALLPLRHIHDRASR